MSEDLLALVLRFNLGLAAAIALVLLIRAPVRRWFGAQIGYALWLIPPLAAAMAFVPARIVTVIVPAHAPSAPDIALGAIASSPNLFAQAIDLTMLALALWTAGAVVSLFVLALRQHAFVRGLGRLTPRTDWGAGVFSAESKEAGPALVGVLRPLIVAPADFDTRYSAEEQRVILAHERAHMAQGDPLINAAAALLQCVNWFNPLMHVAANALRADQEFACDAAVLARAETARRLYAEALFKARLAGGEVPLGCAWPPASLDAFKERLHMLKRNTPSRTQMLLGASAIAVATAAVCAVAWASQPPRTVTIVETRSDELAGGPDLAEPAAQVVREAIINAERAAADSAREIAENERYLRAHRDELNLANEEVVRITREAQANMRASLAEARQHMREDQDGMRERERAAREAAAEARARVLEHDVLSRAERAQIEREAAEEVRAAMQEARGEMRAAQAQRRFTAQNSAAMGQIREHSRAISADALQIARLNRMGAGNESAIAALEADMDTHEAMIDQLTSEIEAQVDEDIGASD